MVKTSSSNAEGMGSNPGQAAKIPHATTKSSHAATKAWCSEVSQSVSQFSGSVMSDSLRPHGMQHARPTVHHQLTEFTQTHVH